MLLPRRLIGLIIAIKSSTCSRVERDLSLFKGNATPGREQFTQFFQLLLLVDRIHFKLLEAAVAFAELTFTPGANLY